MSDGYGRGDVVVYAGSVAIQRGQWYYVDSVNLHGRLSLCAVEHPTVGRLLNVKPASVQPTGEHLVLCLCGHALKLLRPGAHGVCGSCGCQMHDWSDQPPAVGPQLTADEVKMRRFTAYRWVCVACGLADGYFGDAATALAAGAGTHPECSPAGGGGR